MNTKVTGGASAPFGWELVIERRTGMLTSDTHQVHYRGCTEAQARKKAMLRTGSIRVLSCTAVSREEWINAYGLGRS